MYRDFTYIDDTVNGIILLIKKIPKINKNKMQNDSLSVAPFRILNIGNTKVYLLDFIKQIEKELGKKAIRNYMPLQKGDVKQTLSNSYLLKITGYNPKTNYKLGIKKFINWFKILSISTKLNQNIFFHYKSMLKRVNLLIFFFNLIFFFYFSKLLSFKKRLKFSIKLFFKFDSNKYPPSLPIISVGPFGQLLDNTWQLL